MRRVRLVSVVLPTLLFLSLVLSPSIFAQQTAPDPADSSTSICDEVTTTSGNKYPAYCSDRDNRLNIGGGTDPASDISSPIIGPNSITYKIVQVVTVVTGTASVIMIIVGGFRYVVSGGDSSATKAAKDTILYAVIGLAITIFAQTIITFVLSKL